MSMKPILETSLSGLTSHSRGKVRDMYEIEDKLLMVTTDRISAFDFVLESGIPDKGKVLTQLSAFWFGQTKDIVANHFITMEPSEYPVSTHVHESILKGRSMLVKRTEPILIECVARGYLSGSGWKDYCKTGSVCGVPLASGLRESEKLPSPIFTPATKAASGHDINISEEEAGQLIGRELITRLKEITLALYTRGATHAESRNIIVADTKFEFGLIKNGEKETIILIDEVLTPDSSRFWPMADYEPGRAQPSFDKQYVRDYLEEIKWNKQPPVPSLPDEVVMRTREKYIEAFRTLSSKNLS